MPGQNGSHADRGDSIVLGCGHTWGYVVQPGTCTRYEAGDYLWGDRYGQTMGFARISRSIPSRVLPKSAGRCIAGMMETHNELPERVQRKQQLTALDLGLDQNPAPRHGTQAQRDHKRALIDWSSP
jgi:hypothetical protein